jgi:hypothetical protein
METGAEPMEDAELMPPPDPAPLPVAPARKVKPIVPPPPESTLRQVDREAEGDVGAWLRGMGETAIKVNIFRKSPKTGPNGEAIGGSLETVEELIDESYIREMWGGGTFSLKVSLPRGKNASYIYVAGRTIELAGPPKMHGQLLVHGAQSAAAVPLRSDEDSELAKRGMNMAETIMMQERERAERAERELRDMARRPQPTGLDPAMVAQITAPYERQIDALQAAIGRLEARISQPPPKDELRDTLIEKAFSAENKQLELIRATYDARIEKLKDEHEAALKRMEDRNDRFVANLEARHAREIAQLERAADRSSDGSKQAFEARIESLKESVTRLERELGAKEAELGVLRAQKNQTPAEKAEEIMKLKETFEALGGDGDEEPSTWEKVAGLVGNLPAVNKIAERFAGGGQPQQQQQVQQVQQPRMLPVIGQPFRAPDGNVYVHVGNGNIVTHAQYQAQQRRLSAKRRARAQVAQTPANDDVDAAVAAAEQAEGGADGGAEEVAEPQLAEPQPVFTGTPPDADDVKMAIGFMENAIRGNADPASFGATARNLVSADILRYLQAVGIEQFLASVQLDPGSPLTTVRGRIWARKVFKFLTEGTTE